MKRSTTTLFECTSALVSILLLCMTQPILSAQPPAYVVNSIGETLSKIDLSTGTVTNNILSLGSDVSSAPNQIVIFDARGFVTNSLTNEIQVIDIFNQVTLAYWPMPSGSNPFWMSVYDIHTMYVSLTLYNSVARVNLQTGAIENIDSIGVSPQQMLIHDHLLYISNTALDFNSFSYGQGTVAIWDIRGDLLLDVIPVGTNPQQLAIDADNRIHVICTGNYVDQFGIVYVVDPLTRSVIDSMPTGGSPGGLTITDDNRGWIAAGGFASSGELYVYDADALVPFHDASNPISTGLGCTAVESWSDNGVFAVTLANQVEKIQADFSSGPTYAVGSGPTSIAMDYMPGDLNGDMSVDISDLTRMVDLLFISFEPLASPRWRADVDGSLGVDISDLTLLVDHLFISISPILYYGAPWQR